MNSDFKVLVVCGGMSSEREVSLRSGKAVAAALKEYGYKNVELFDLNCNNANEIFLKKPDIVYLALHGKYGEDGCIQGMLELANIPYTGPGVSSSAVCMDKILTKRILSSANIPTAKFVAFDIDNASDDVIKETETKIADEIGLPVVLKSPCEGSSVGVVIVKEREKLNEAIAEVLKYGKSILAEEYLQGVELTLPILGNDELTVLPTVEIASENEFYDYEAKYTSGKSMHVIPARISSDDIEKVNKIGKDTYRVLGCRGISRIDFIVDKKKGPMVIEVNTLPGMTATSLFPDSAKHIGITFPELANKILELGIHD